MPSPKIVIIGAGFGGLKAAKLLGKKNVGQVVLIDKTNHHLFQPLLYQVASAALSPTDIAAPIREILSQYRNTYVMMGDVVSIDKENHCIHLQNDTKIQYDYLIVATGARHSYFGNSHWEKFAPGLKTLDDALTIRERILMSFERAEGSACDKEVEKHLNFIIIGGGPTGVEMAGAIAEIAHKTMRDDFRKINVSKTKIYLVEGLSHLLNTYPEKLSNRARRDLTKLGVDVITGKRVTDITEDGVLIGDTFIPTHNVIWAAGNQASPLLKTLNSELDKQGRVIVDADLSLPNHPEIFVIGDAACAKDKNGQPIPAVAPAAMQQGRYVAKLIIKQLPKEKRPAFKYLDKGSMAMVATGKAIMKMGPIELSGWLAWLGWGFIHILFLIGFRNRLGVCLEWIYELITGGRRSRLISKPIEDYEKSHKARLAAIKD
ncbi:MAG: NAD(P)/FAD-dependent oxidoreductase [Parachlamydiales bacterium]|nr:NAD(P)/FAD-dependent oxidoreductase [Parachlamydiales bacterium]